MTIKAELGYIEYASLCNIGRQLCDLPEDIQDEIEEFMVRRYELSPRRSGC